MVKNKYMQFCMENLKEKRKRTKNYHPEQGFEPQIFSNFPALDLNFKVIRTNLLSLLKSDLTPLFFIPNTVESRFKKDFGSDQNLS